MPQIEVTFDIDANGIVNVSAKDMGTQKEQKITITASSGLSKDEVDRMMKEAESHADEDKKRREEIEARNRADQAVYGGRADAEGHRRQAVGVRQGRIEARWRTLKKAIEANDTAAMNGGDGDADGRAAQGGRGAVSAGRPRPGHAGGEPTPGPAAGRAPRRAQARADGDVIDAEVVDDKK